MAINKSIKEKEYSPLSLYYLKHKDNGKFWNCLQEQIRMQYLPIKELKKIQWEKFKKLIDHAYQNVPFYKELFDKADIKPNDIKRKSDIQKIPIVTKEDLRKAFREGKCIAKNITNSRWVYEKTSGSTNEPFEFYKDKNEEMLENCCLLRQKLITGYGLGESSLLMRGLEPKKPIKQKILGLLFKKRHFLCLFNIDEKRIPGYIHLIKDKKIKLIECFPSGLKEIAIYIKREGIDIKVNSVISCGEKLSIKDKKVIEEAFNTKVFENYSAAEVMELAFGCELRNGLHIDNSRYLLELIKNNKPAKKGEEGEVIVTNLNNYVMPFIRYKLGDKAAFAKKKCSCGRGFPLIKELKGRIIENFKTPDGRILNYHFFSTVLDNEHENILKYQIARSKNNQILINIVPNATFSDTIKNRIYEEISEHVGSSMKIKICLVSEIPKGNTGKHIMMKPEVA